MGAAAPRGDSRRVEDATVRTNKRIPDHHRPHAWNLLPLSSPRIDRKTIHRLERFGHENVYVIGFARSFAGMIRHRVRPAIRSKELPALGGATRPGVGSRLLLARL